MAREKTEVVPSHVCIPSGKPPILLPVPPKAGEASGAAPTPTGEEGELDLLSGSAGLVDGAEALANELDSDNGDGDLGELPEAEAEGPQFTEEGIPTDETIMTWVRAIRAKRLKTDNEFLSREALQYWVRYSYDPSTNPVAWRAVRTRLEVLVRT